MPTTVSNTNLACIYCTAVNPYVHIQVLSGVLFLVVTNYILTRTLTLARPLHTNPNLNPTIHCVLTVKLGSLDSQDARCLDSQDVRCLDSQDVGCLDSQVTGCLDSQDAGCLDSQDAVKTWGVLTVKTRLHKYKYPKTIQIDTQTSHLSFTASYGQHTYTYTNL
eukprot:1393261-Amorphochlora_amoeboformis.AAC.1